MEINRVSVIGATGSGKTTFARQLAEKLGCAHIELDALHWEPNWVEAPLEIFRQCVDEATRDARWVVDGNYSAARDLVWGRADTVVWLDFPFRTVLWRLSRRTFGRALHRVELFARPEYAHLRLVRLRSAREADAWLENEANFIFARTAKE